LVTEEADIKFLTHCLEQATQLAKEVKSKKLEITVENNPFLCQELIAGNWESSLQTFEEKIEQAYIYRNELMLHKLKKLPKTQMVWEGIQFYVQNPVFEPKLDRFIYPFVTAILNRTDSLCYVTLVNESEDEVLGQLSERLAQTMIEIKLRPSKIIVEEQVRKEMIQQFCESLQIACEVSNDLEVAYEFMEYMLNPTQNDMAGLDFDLGDIEELLVEIEENCADVLVSSLADEMSPKEMQHFTSNIIHFAIAMYQLFEEFDESWSTENAKEVCLNILPSALPKEEYSCLGKNLYHYIEYMKFEMDMAFEDELLTDIPKWFKW
ncbi:MAG: DUF6930 domain-containing protein, partial [Turicibacter sp.]